MKIQCDVCEKAPATIICCADEAALCPACDVQVHAANKLASKHQRLLLQNLSAKLPRCDICQDKAAFIFCVEDRALFCRDCDQSIHVPGTLSADHHRLLATGIRVALGSPCGAAKDTNGPADPAKKQSNAVPPPKPIVTPAAPARHPPPPASGIPQPQHAPLGFSTSPAAPWTDDDFFHLADYACGDKRGSTMGLGELEWLADVGLFQEDDEASLAMAEVPELSVSPSSTTSSFHKPTKSSWGVHKKPRTEVDVDLDFFTVPDLG